MQKIFLIVIMFVFFGCDGGTVAPLPTSSNAPVDNSGICSDAIECQNKGLEYAAQGEESGYIQARLYFKRACELGESEGCNNLAFLNANARGGQQSYTLAYRYWGIACKMGNELGCTNLELAKNMVADMRKEKGMQQ